jgi:hypothetical protein
VPIRSSHKEQGTCVEDAGKYTLAKFKEYCGGMNRLTAKNIQKLQREVKKTDDGQNITKLQLLQSVKDRENKQNIAQLAPSARQLQTITNFQKRFRTVELNLMQYENELKKTEGKQNLQRELKKTEDEQSIADNEVKKNEGEQNLQSE